MEKLVLMAVNNECYKVNRNIVPTGIMIHSTATPGVMAERFAKSWNVALPDGRQVCVHAFIDDTTLAQILPWNHRAWHCAGDGNNYMISYEMCEPSNWKNDKWYFEKVWKNMVAECVVKCKQFNIKPSAIMSHKEGHAAGIASDHRDPEHWMTYFGKTMDDFRKDVAIALNPPKVVVPSFKPFLIRITCDTLNVRSKPSLFSSVVGKITGSDISYTIIAISGKWGLLKSGLGWINLGYTRKV